MDTNSVSSVQRRRATKRSKSKEHTIKVVYISNPMKVKTSASEFRALVQELTGQDAESPPDPSRFRGANSGGGGNDDGGHKMDSDNSVTKAGHENDHTLAMPQVDANSHEGHLGRSMERFEPFDDVFTPEMIENISAFLPASVFYESAQVDEVLRRLDAV